MNRRREITIVLALICFGALVRIHFLAATPNLFSVEAEGYSKIQLMLQWDQSPLLYPDINFGPLHMPLLKWPWKLTGSRVLANRIVSLLLGIGLLPLVWALARRLFGPAPALGSLAFLTLAMLPVKTSTVTLAEGPAVFSLALGLYLLQVFTDRKAGGFGLFFGSAAALAAMTALRFETWLFLPILPLWVWKQRGFAPALAFGALLAAFPLAHLYVSWLKAGDPFQFLHVSAAITAMNSARVPVAQRVFGFATSMGYTCTWVVGALIPVGLVLIFKNRKGVLIGILLTAILTVYQYKGVRATLAPELYRYLTIPCVLAAFVWVLPVHEILQRFLRSRSVQLPVVMVIVGLIFGSWSYLSVWKEERPMAASKSVFQMMDQLRPTLDPNDRILVGSEYHPVIVVESDLEWRNFRLPEFPDAAHASAESLRQIMDEYKPNKMLVYEGDSLFVDTLKLDPICGAEHNILGTRFCRQGAVENWCWYQRCETTGE